MLLNTAASFINTHVAKIHLSLMPPLRSNIGILNPRFSFHHKMRPKCKTEHFCWNEKITLLINKNHKTSVITDTVNIIGMFYEPWGSVIARSRVIRKPFKPLMCVLGVGMIWSRLYLDQVPHIVQIAYMIWRTRIGGRRRNKESSTTIQKTLSLKESAKPSI